MIRSTSFVRLVAASACIVVSITVFKYSDLLFASRSRPVSNSSYACLVDHDPAHSSALPPPVTVELENHNYAPDGLLVVNPNGRHPIYELVKRAEANWRSKLSRASKTLEDAVVEYQRRYHRPPPLGFDVWWQYAVNHNVQLPDDYDQIHRDLEPYWGFNPVDLAATLSELEKRKGLVVLGKAESQDTVTVLNSTLSDERQHLLKSTVKELLDVIRDVERDLPPFRAMFSPLDNPSMLSDHAIKSMALEAAAAGTFINVKDLPPVTEDGWTYACSPSSPARLSPLDSEQLPAHKTFIHNHHLSMDPCLHPYLLSQHGQFLSHNPRPQKTLVPRFSLCSTMLHHDIRPATPYSWVDDLPKIDNPPWEERLDERLLWRGSNTGMYHGPKTRWGEGHRGRLIRWAHDLIGLTSVLPPTTSDSEKLGNPQEVRKTYINPALLDIEFAGHPVGCAPEVCDILQKEFDWRQRQTIKQAGNYKYVLDVDGNGWSSRFKRLLTSNSLVFKSTVYPEWYMDRIEPWVHYIPVQVDLSDLRDVFVFFRGGTNGEGAHEEMAKRIADAGRHWSRSFWRKEDMTAYTFRLFLEYARVMSVDRDGMNYHGPS